MATGQALSSRSVFPGLGSSELQIKEVRLDRLYPYGIAIKRWVARRSRQRTISSFHRSSMPVPPQLSMASKKRASGPVET
jgi:hypothetical protein